MGLFAGNNANKSKVCYMGNLFYFVEVLAHVECYLSILQREVEIS